MNADFLDPFSHTEVEHLPRNGSDHAPLLLNCERNFSNYKRTFRFLNFFIDHEEFKNVVRQNWDTYISPNPFLDFKRNIRKIKKVLTLWSSKIYGDIFQQLIIRDEIARIKEQHFEEFPSVEIQL